MKSNKVGLAHDLAEQIHETLFPSRYGFFAHKNSTVIYDNNPVPHYECIRERFEAALDSRRLRWCRGIHGDADTPDYTVAWVVDGDHPDLIDVLLGLSAEQRVAS